MGAGKIDHQLNYGDDGRVTCARCGLGLQVDIPPDAEMQMWVTSARQQFYQAYPDCHAQGAERVLVSLGGPGLTPLTLRVLFCPPMADGEFERWSAACLGLSAQELSAMLHESLPLQRACEWGMLVTRVQRWEYQAPANAPVNSRWAWPREPDPWVEVDPARAFF